MAVRTVVIQVTGLADVASADLGGKTPLEIAATPVLDELASRGILGLMRTIPEGGLATVSAATAGILGLDAATEIPAPGAVAAAGIELEIPGGSRALCPSRLALAEQETGGPAVVETRFPGLSIDHGMALAQALDEAVEPMGARVHAASATTYVVVFADGDVLALDGPPDLALGKSLGDVLPGGEAKLRTFMARARAALWEHPACVGLRAQGAAAPTDVWPWGAGSAGVVPAFFDHFGVRGAAVVAAPLPRGVARLCGLVTDPPRTPGGSATLAARVERALALSAGCEFVLLHVETVDATGPRGDATAKAEAISRVDAELLAPMVSGLRSAGGDWRLAVVADVTSSSVTRRYTADPVPFVVASPRDAGRASAPQ